MQAAVNGRIKHVEDLIKAKADVNAQNAGGETALMWAAAYDEVDVIKVLLKNKASPKLKDELGWTALMVAAWAGNSKAVEALKSSSDKSATNADGLRAEQLAAVDVSPAKTRGTQKAVRSALGIKKGGRHKTQRRKKTNSKKRGTR
jgi:ankyrin repeat protein